MKRAIWLPASIVLTAVLCFLTGISTNARLVHRDSLGLENDMRQMSNELDKMGRRLDAVAGRINVYQTLSEGAENRLSGLEVWQITDIIIGYCRRNKDIDLTPAVILAVWRQESNFDPLATSNKDALGMGQLMWLTALPHLYDMGHVRPNRAILYDSVVNAEVSIRELVRLRRYYVGMGVGDWLWPISAYFWGTGNIGKVIWYGYQVMGRAEKYREGGL